MIASQPEEPRSLGELALVMDQAVSRLEREVQHVRYIAVTATVLAVVLPLAVWYFLHGGL